MGAKGHGGGEQVEGEIVEARAEVGVTRVGALMEVWVGGAVRVLEEVVLLCC